MSDFLMRSFRAQLTTSMDSVLRGAVFKIMTIFENSLHDHQVELAQKGEEIAQLKIKLQNAEVRLSENQRAGDGGPERKQSEPEKVLSGPEEAPDASEFNFEGIDDAGIKMCSALECSTLVAGAAAHLSAHSSTMFVSVQYLMTGVPPWAMRPWSSEKTLFVPV